GPARVRTRARRGRSGRRDGQKKTPPSRNSGWAVMVRPEGFEPPHDAAPEAAALSWLSYGRIRRCTSHYTPWSTAAQSPPARAARQEAGGGGEKVCRRDLVRREIITPLLGGPPCSERFSWPTAARSPCA